MTPTAEKTAILRTFGITQIVAAVFAGGLCFLSLIGLAMCTDGRSQAYCSSVSHSYLLLVVATLALVIAGIVTTVEAPRLSHRWGTVVAIDVAVLGATLAAIIRFWSLAS